MSKAGKKTLHGRRKCIAIDVDGTLLAKGKLNQPLADWILEKKQSGVETILWSARGREHARTFAESHGI